MRQFSIRPLGRERIAQAFALVQAALGGVTLADWRRFARRYVSNATRARAGILAVTDERDYIAGLGVYRIETDLRHGPALVAEHFIALDLIDRAGVADALAEALERLARERGCAAIHTTLSEACVRLQVNDGGPAAVLQGRGHRLEALRLCKPLERPGGRAPGAGHGPGRARTAAAPVRIG